MSKKVKATMYGLRDRKTKKWYTGLFEPEYASLAHACFFATRREAKSIMTHGTEEIVPLRVTVLTSKKSNAKRTR